MKTRRYSVAFLLLLVASSGMAQATTQTPLITDTFTRTNAASLGNNWSQMNAGSNCSIVSNSAQSPVGNTKCTAMFGANDFPNNQFAQVTTSTLIGASSSVQVFVRMLNSCLPGNANSTFCGYAALGQLATPYKIFTVTNSIFAAIATSAQNAVQGDVVLLTVQDTSTGPQLTLFVNTVQVLQVTDTSKLFSAGQPGVSIAPDATATDAAVTNFVAGSVSTAPTILNATRNLASGGLVQLTNPTAITTTGQAVQFIVLSNSYPYLGRLQIITTGQVSNPQWVLECSQDSSSTWFQMPAMSLPTFGLQLGDVPPASSVFYDLSGLSFGPTCRFGLAVTANTTITGNVQVWVVAG